MAGTFFKFNPWFALNPYEIGGAELKLLIFLCYSMNWQNVVIYDDVESWLLEKMLVQKQELKRLLKLLEKKGLIERVSYKIIINEQFAKKGR